MHLLSIFLRAYPTQRNDSPPGTFHKELFVRGMYVAGLPAPGARDVGTLGGETFRSTYHMIRRPPLRLVGGDHVPMAPLPELSGNTYAFFSLECAIQRDSRNR